MLRAHRNAIDIEKDQPVVPRASCATGVESASSHGETPRRFMHPEAGVAHGDTGPGEPRPLHRIAAHRVADRRLHGRKQGFDAAQLHSAEAPRSGGEAGIAIIIAGRAERHFRRDLQPVQRIEATVAGAPRDPEQSARAARSSARTITSRRPASREATVTGAKSSPRAPLAKLFVPDSSPPSI